MSSLWKVFIDDSADQKKEKYVLAGALIGTKNDWHAFDRSWNKALKQSPRLEYFHGKELRTLDGEFRQFRSEQYPAPTGRAAANLKRDVLREVIEDSKIVAIGIGVLIKDYESVRSSHPLGPTHMASDAFEWVLQNALIQAVAAVKKVTSTARIRFLSDDSSKSKRYEAVYSDCKVKNPNSALSMLDFSHSDDKLSPGLQAADMIASQVKAVYDDHHANGEINQEIPLLDQFYKIAMVDEAYITKVLNGQSNYSMSKH